MIRGQVDNPWPRTAVSKINKQVFATKRRVHSLLNDTMPNVGADATT